MLIGPEMTIGEVSVSPLNMSLHVDPARSAAAQVTLNDVTLREAPGAGIAIGGADSRRVVELLIAAGIKQFQLPAQPASSTLIDEALRPHRDLQVELLALAFLDDWKAQVDACVNAGADIVHITNRSSDRLMALGQGSRAETLQRTSEAVRYAQSRGVNVAFAPSDSTRADLEFLSQLWECAAGAGAMRVYVTDTVGVATPEVIYHMVGRARAVSGLEVGVHCHNDFGLATANAIAGFRAGATVIDVAVNGIGDRAGNASLDEVAAALNLLYEAGVGIDLGMLTDLGRFVAEVSLIPLSPSKPVTGEMAFSHHSPTHVAAIQRDARSLQPFEPSLVGNEQKLCQHARAK